MDIQESSRFFKLSNINTLLLQNLYDLNRSDCYDNYIVINTCINDRGGGGGFKQSPRDGDMTEALFPLLILLFHHHHCNSFWMSW